MPRTPEQEARATRSPEVVYNPKVPIDQFDFIITDECHCSIYKLWREALEYFDAYLIGLIATPTPLPQLLDELNEAPAA